MIWLSWRQARMFSAVAAAALTAAVLMWVTTRPSQDPVTGHLIGGSDLVQLLNTGLLAVPVLIGAFLGAPLVARELETGTWQLAWTQSTSRNRWLASKIGVVGSIGIAVSAMATFGVNWWSRALDAVDANRFAAAVFSERGIVPIAYTAFALALGICAGALLRHTVAAVATTLAMFTTARVVTTLYLRPRYLTPVNSRRPLTSSVTNDGGWILTPHRYQPATRFWTFQWIEAGIFLALAAALVTVSFWCLHRRST